MNLTDRTNAVIGQAAAGYGRFAEAATHIAVGLERVRMTGGGHDDQAEADKFARQKLQTALEMINEGNAYLKKLLAELVDGIEGE